MERRVLTRTADSFRLSVKSQKYMELHAPRLIFAAGLLAWLVLSAAGSPGAQTNTLTGGGGSPATAVAVADNGGGLPHGTDLKPSAEDDNSNQQLNQLVQERLADHSPSDYPIGPGDVLELSVPDMPELRSRTVRVSGVNTVSVPIIGEINVAGLTQDEIKEKIRARLLRYMHDPQLDLFVREYHSRDVAVMGMVQKPGIYTLDSPRETVLDVIGKAGGSTERAANTVLLIPAGATDAATENGGYASLQAVPEANLPAGSAGRESSQNSPGRPQAPIRPSSASGARGTSPDSYSEAQRQRGVLIDLSGTSDPALLALQARPGDLMIVPAAGEVMVQGWVRNPGAFTITPNMTALGAVTAAGGEMFSSSAVLLRTEQSHHQVELRLDLAKIREHTAEDPFIQSGDIVIVNRSATGAVPYLAYLLFDKIGGGIYGSPF
jgi:polysaccharide biosynthesis/export protein